MFHLLWSERHTYLLVLKASTHTSRILINAKYCIYWAFRWDQSIDLKVIRLLHQVKLSLITSRILQLKRLHMRSWTQYETKLQNIDLSVHFELIRVLSSKKLNLFQSEQVPLNDNTCKGQRYMKECLVRDTAKFWCKWLLTLILKAFKPLKLLVRYKLSI